MKGDSSSATQGQQRVALLGAGPSSLACAYMLSSTDALRERYDLTIYTMGWRIGGKGASGRADHGRIEEHGLHVLFGCYHNFFRIMRQCYDEIDRPAGHPLRTWQDAFKPNQVGVVEDYFKDQWDPWVLLFPFNDATPGDAGKVLPADEYLKMFTQAAIGAVFGWKPLKDLTDTGVFKPDLLPNMQSDPISRAAFQLLGRLLRLAGSEALHLHEQHKQLLRLLKRLRKLAWPFIRTAQRFSTTAHRFWLGLDFIASLLTGIITDRVYLPGGLRAIDHLDFREWLEQHGAHPLTLEGPWGRTLYDAAFSYEDGDPNKQRMAAGVGLHLFFWCSMYRGSMYFKMQSGMGDTVFTPLYEVLKSRGVKFEFFHKVDALHVSEDGQSIDRVSMTQQAQLKAGRSEYKPLKKIKDLACWPAQPRYKQLKDGADLKSVNLESYYETSPHAKPCELRAGRDYDQLVFGIPIGAVPFVCKELLHRPQWAQMVDQVTSVQTYGVQLWCKPTLAELGWKTPAPLLSLYVEPLNTWCDMTQVAKTEDWPRRLEPGSVHYFTGAQRGPKHAPDPQLYPEWEQEEFEKVRKKSLYFANNGLLGLFPNAASGQSQPDAFDWNLLVDAKNRIGRKRFKGQYYRSNAGPSERCTLAAPGSIQARMKAADTGFDNLFVTGDWTDNLLYAACMEGAFCAGMLTASALSGESFPVENLLTDETGALTLALKPR